MKSRRFYRRMDYNVTYYCELMGWHHACLYDAMPNLREGVVKINCKNCEVYKTMKGAKK